MIKQLYLLRLNKRLRSLDVDIADNKNIGKESLGKKGLHLNPRDSDKHYQKHYGHQKNDMMLVVFNIVILSLR